MTAEQPPAGTCPCGLEDAERYPHATGRTSVPTSPNCPTHYAAEQPPAGTWDAEAVARYHYAPVTVVEPQAERAPNVGAAVQHDLELRARAGTRLHPWNGRDALADAYEQALDLCCYLKQRLMEHEDAGAQVAASLGITDEPGVHVLDDGLGDEMRYGPLACETPDGGVPCTERDLPTWKWCAACWAREWVASEWVAIESVEGMAAVRVEGGLPDFTRLDELRSAAVAMPPETWRRAQELARKARGRTRG